jgi:hypothetical protein
MSERDIEADLAMCEARERNKSTARTRAIEALFAGDNRAALDAINAMAEAPQKLKVV